LLITVLLAALFTPETAAACSCVEVSAEDAFASHAAVFEGRVVEVRGAADPAGATVAVLEVVQGWKGMELERVEVSTPASSSMCGISFEPETSWLIYADRAGDAFTTDLCQRTRPIESADEDIAFLGAGVVPVEITEDDEVEPADEEPPARGGCGSCAVTPTQSSVGWFASLALGLFWLVRRR